MTRRARERRWRHHRYCYCCRCRRRCCCCDHHNCRRRTHGTGGGCIRPPWWQSAPEHRSRGGPHALRPGTTSCILPYWGSAQDPRPPTRVSQSTYEGAQAGTQAQREAAPGMRRARGGPASGDAEACLFRQFIGQWLSSTVYSPAKTSKSDFGSPLACMAPPPSPPGPSRPCEPRIAKSLISIMPSAKMAAQPMSVCVISLSAA